eukprot:TRINITY_DN569_c0_g1_i1.p1 TRINITY_DN569_c0_g1~~TRINITY_DN569_c0_g1_i1.p1  ORF type:complete len:200 (-),score=29.23 TRINITY_DN569_c0_g1_i1:55-654(-)
MKIVLFLFCLFTLSFAENIIDFVLLDGTWEGTFQMPIGINKRTNLTECMSRFVTVNMTYTFNQQEVFWYTSSFEEVIGNDTYFYPNSSNVLPDLIQSYDGYHLVTEAQDQIWTELGGNPFCCYYLSISGDTMKVIEKVNATNIFDFNHCPSGNEVSSCIEGDTYYTFVGSLTRTSSAMLRCVSLFYLFALVAFLLFSFE